MEAGCIKCGGKVVRTIIAIHKVIHYNKCILCGHPVEEKMEDDINTPVECTSCDFVGHTHDLDGNKCPECGGMVKELQ